MHQTVDAAAMSTSAGSRRPEQHHALCSSCWICWSNDRAAKKKLASFGVSCCMQNMAEMASVQQANELVQGAARDMSAVGPASSERRLHVEAHLSRPRTRNLEPVLVSLVHGTLLQRVQSKMCLDKCQEVYGAGGVRIHAPPVCLSHLQTQHT